MRGHRNRPRQAPGAASAPGRQPGARQEPSCGAAGCPEEPGWRAVSPAPRSGRVPPTAREECEGQGIAPPGSSRGSSGGAGHCQFLLIQPVAAGQRGPARPLDWLQRSSPWPQPSTLPQLGRCRCLSRSTLWLGGSAVPRRTRLCTGLEPRGFLCRTGPAPEKTSSRPPSQPRLCWIRPFKSGPGAGAPSRQTSPTRHDIYTSLSPRGSQAPPPQHHPRGSSLGPPHTLLCSRAPQLPGHS